MSMRWFAPAALGLALLATSASADEPPKPVEGSAPAAAEAVGVAFEPGTPAFADVLAKATKETKPIFLDFFTDW